jgi:flavin reductase (DIM6/NTAB) family NADH-FMN oxidoreductase RutF
MERQNKEDAKMANFREIKSEQITDNVIKLIGKDWMLITAGKMDNFNTMTASWGGLGNLWNSPVCFCFVRPQRYSFLFMEREENFTLTFFDEAYRKALTFCGTKSGRDVDKVAETGLTPLSGTTGAVYFEEARLVLECRKLYTQDLLAENFVDASLVKAHYAAGDFHRLYVGEIVRCLVRE